VHSPKGVPRRILAGLFLLGLQLLSPTSAVCPAEPTPATRRLPNVLLLTVDSLRPDHLGCYGYEKPTSPWIDRLAREGTRFENAISQGGWTSPAMVSILTGLYPSVHGVEGRPDGFPCLARAPLMAWRAAGYRVPGCESIDEEPNYSRLGFQPDPAYGNTTEQFFSWVRGHRDEPFFCWYHIGKTPHLPYAPGEAYRELFSPPDGGAPAPEQRKRLEIIQSQVLIPRGTLPLEAGDLPWILALYDGEVRMADDTVGSIYDFLEQEELLGDTLLILTADQAEELMDHGFIGHASTSWAGTVYEEIVHVPLIVRFPEAVPAGKVIAPVVETFDLLPTLHDLVGIPSRTPFQGRSLLPLIRGDAAPWTDTAFSETSPCGYQCARAPEKRLDRIQAVRSGPWKLMATHTPAESRFALYHLASDPREKHDLAHSHPQVADRLKDLLIHQQYSNRLLRQQLLEACSPAPGS